MTDQPTTSVLSPADQGTGGGAGEEKASLFSLVEMFPQVGGEQAADALVRDENVKVVQQASLGFKRFVLFLQDIVWDDLAQTEGGRVARVTSSQWFVELEICHFN